MHPNPAFRWDEAGMRAFVEGEGFGALFVRTPAGPRVAHVPLTFEGDSDGDGDGRILFHLAAANAVTSHLVGATALFVVGGPHAYVSPTWYGAGPDEVPTWNYMAVEIEGTVAAIDRAALCAQIDALVARYEPADGWRMSGMDVRRRDAMLDAIRGFALSPTAWRGTRKLSQNKPEAVRERVATVLGDHGIARAMRAA